MTDSVGGWTALKKRLLARFTQRLTDEIQPTPPLSFEASRLIETLYHICEELDNVGRSCDPAEREAVTAHSGNILGLTKELDGVVQSRGAGTRAQQILDKIKELVDTIGQMAADGDWNELGDELFDEFYHRNSIVEAGIRAGKAL